VADAGDAGRGVHDLPRLGCGCGTVSGKRHLPPIAILWSIAVLLLLCRSRRGRGV
jgi:hypothetical protein